MGAPTTREDGGHISSAVWAAALSVFTLAFALRVLPHAAAALARPYYEDMLNGNLAVDLLRGGPITSVFDYAHTPPNNLVSGILLAPIFAFTGSRYAVVMAMHFAFTAGAWLTFFALLGRAAGRRAALWAMPAVLLMSDALAYSVFGEAAQHARQILWTALQLAAFLAFHRDPRRAGSALLFGLVSGLSLFEIWENALSLATFGLLAAAVFDKRTLTRFVILAFPGIALGAGLTIPLLRPGYGVAAAGASQWFAHLADIVTGGMPAVFSMGSPTTPGTLALAVLAAAWLGLAILRRREIASAARNIPGITARPLHPAAVFDLFLILLPPIWLLGAAAHSWPAGEQNWRYLCRPAAILLLIPGRLAIRGRWGFIALVAILATQAAAITTPPSLAPLRDPDRRASLAVSASGFRGDYYPVYLSRGLSRRLVEADAERFAELVARVSPAWRGFAVREMALRLLAEHRMSPRSFSFSVQESSMFEEGLGAGAVAAAADAVERGGEAGVLAAAILSCREQPDAPRDTTVSANSMAGVGAAWMLRVSGLGSSEDAMTRIGTGGGVVDRWIGEAQALVAALTPDLRLAFARGMGRSLAERRLPDETVNALLVRLGLTTPDAAIALYEGFGEGWARYWFTMAEHWMAGDGLLCPFAPEEYQSACEAAFRREAAFLGLTIVETDTPSGRIYEFRETGLTSASPSS